MIPGTRVLPGLVSDMLFSWNLLEPWDLKQGIIGNQVKASLIEKACLDYCEDLTRSCDFFSCPNKIVLFTDWEASLVCLNIFERLLDFSQQWKNWNIQNFLKDHHNSHLQNPQDCTIVFDFALQKNSLQNCNFVNRSKHNFCLLGWRRIWATWINSLAL